MVPNTNTLPARYTYQLCRAFHVATIVCEQLSVCRTTRGQWKPKGEAARPVARPRGGKRVRSRAAPGSGERGVAARRAAAADAAAAAQLEERRARAASRAAAMQQRYEARAEAQAASAGLGPADVNLGGGDGGAGMPGRKRGAAEGGGAKPWGEVARNSLAPNMCITYFAGFRDKIVNIS